MGPSTDNSFDPGELHLRAYWDVVVARRRVVLACTLGLALFLLVLGLLTRPVYQASTTLQIEPDAPKILSFDNLLQADTTTDAFYQTQYRLIESRSVAQRVIETQGLLDGDGSDGPGFVSKSIGFIASVPSRMLMLVRSVIGTAPPEIDTEALVVEYIDERYTRAINDFLSRLQVQPIRNTRLVAISWKDHDPVLASRITNAIAETYIDINLEAKFETTEQAGQFLSSEIERLRSEIDTSEAELQRYGNERDIISLDERQDTVTQALADLSAEYTRAQTDRVQKQTYFEQLQNADPSSIPEVFSNALVQRLKADYAGLQQQYSEMSRRFTDDWPDMQRLRGQMEELEGRIAEQEQSIAAGLVRSARANYDSAVEQENRISGLLEDQRAEAMTLNRNLATYRALQLEIDSNNALLESLLERQSETGVSARLQGMRTSNIRVVDPATVPLAPSAPRLRLNFILGLLGGLALGIGAAFAQEYLDNTLKSPEEVEARVGLPNLGLVPALGSLNGSRNAYAYGYGDEGYTELLSAKTTPELVAHEHPRSALAESYRNLRTSVLLSSAGSPPQVIVVTSSIPGEGKTTSAINLATSLAQVGKKVLLIDADLRKPRLHSVLGLSPTAGLVHYLTGSAQSLKEVVQKTPVENLWALPSGPRPPNPAELLSSQRTQGMFESLRSAFDVIVVDTPPILAVVDPLVLIPWADGVVLVVHSGQTPYPVVQRASRKVADIQGRILGTMLNQVNFEKMGYYSYGTRKPRTVGRQPSTPAAKPRRSRPSGRPA